MSTEKVYRWKKYNSIDNSYHSAKVKKANEIVPEDETWVVTEKIDGQNASICVYKDGSYRIGRRNSLLAENEKFGKVQEFAKKYIDNFKKVFSLLEYSNRYVDSMIIYGESFGGAYNHKDVEKDNDSKKILNRVQYCPQNEFLPFDISYFDGIEHRMLDHIAIVNLFETFAIPFIRPLFYGTFQECLDYNEEFITTIPSYYDLPPIENNYAEGVVIKPIREFKYYNGDRIIFKHKNKKFNEKKKEKDVKKEYDTHVLKILDLIELFCTESRLYSVISKHSDLTEKDFGKVLKDFSADALKDFCIDYSNEYEDLSKQDQRIVNKHLNTICAKLMKFKYFEAI